MAKPFFREEIDFAPGENKFGLGIVKEKYQDNGSVRTYFKAKLINGVIVIGFTSEGKIILIEEFQPIGLSLPSIIGGGVEKGEDPLETGRRELLEETGYIAGSVELLTTIIKDTRIESNMHVVLALNCRRDSTVEPEKGIKVKLRDPIEFADSFFKQMLTDPEVPHDGTYTLKGICLALYRIGLLQFHAPVHQ